MSFRRVMSFFSLHSLARDYLRGIRSNVWWLKNTVSTAFSEGGPCFEFVLIDPSNAEAHRIIFWLSFCPPEWK
jgi:hypothetical protein